SIEPGRPAPFRGRDERRVLVWGRGRVKPLPRPKRLTITYVYSTLVRVSRGVKDSASTAGLAGRNACGRSIEDQTRMVPWRAGFKEPGRSHVRRWESRPPRDRRE